MGASAASAAPAGGGGSAGRVEYLSDLQGRFAMVQMGWGVLGIDTCAHAPNKTPLKLRIKDKTYTKGLGHHANGVIVVDLDGQYQTFEAEVGVQWQQGNTGTVIFQVYVDGEKRFDSGIMHERDAAKPVRVSVAGASELALVAKDAGDGITCDCADWAEARLVRAENPAPQAEAPTLDIAPFARVVTSDPNRTDGARSSRIEEFRAQDVFLDTDLAPRADGSYAVPAADGKTACIGLLWMERRALREVGISFAPGSPRPAPGDVKVQYWAGESWWQGKWEPMAGELQARDDGFVLRASREANPGLAGGTYKVRWIFAARAPAAGAAAATSAPAVVRRLTAYDGSRCRTVGVMLELDHPRPGRRVAVTTYNGLLKPAGAADFSTRCEWDLGKPLHLQVEYTLPHFVGAFDRTLLLLHLPHGGFGISVPDLLDHDAVWVPDYGVFATREPAPVTLAEYRRRIAGRETVLEMIHQRPDQTFASAMEHVHRAIQDNGPTMLSLACDNRKFIVARDGPITWGKAALRPRFGSGHNADLTRKLSGGWLPAPVTSVHDGGLIYRQRAFVAPLGHEPTDPGHWYAGEPVCVAEYEVENPTGKAAPVSLGLSFAADAEAGRAATITVAPVGKSATAADGDRLLGAVDAHMAGDLRLAAGADAGSVTLTGELAAGDHARCVVCLPAWDAKVSDGLAFPDSPALFSDFQRYWDRIMAPAMQIEIPQPLLQKVIRSSQVRCLIAARNEDDGQRVAPWIAADTYGPLESEAHSVIYGMDLMGHHEFAKRGLDYFIHRYNKAGFLTTGYTIMGTGWHLWVLADHYDLTGDRAWLRSVAPEVARVCAWVERQREKTERLDPEGRRLPEYGLMPPGVMADWGVYGYFFFFNSHFYAGLHRAAQALAAVGQPGAAEWLRDSDDFRDDILRAYGWMQERSPVLPLRDGTWVPCYPSLLYCPGLTADFYPGADWGRVSADNVELGAHQLIANGVLSPTSRQADWIVNYMEDVPFLASGWGDYPAAESQKDPFDLGGFSKLQPYYCRIAEIYSLRDDPKAFLRSYFNALPSLLNTENLTLWEHFHNRGAWDKTHETGWFLVQTHRMFVQARGDELWLAPFVTNNWLKDGMTVAVSQAPTPFGNVGYRIESHVAKGYIDATVEPPTRKRPSAIVLRLRHPEGKSIKSVTVDGKPWTDFDAAGSTVRLTTGAGEMHVRVEY